MLPSPYPGQSLSLQPSPVSWDWVSISRIPSPWRVLISTLAMNMALAFSMGNDINVLLNSNIGQPMAQMFYQSFGQKGTLAIWSIVIIAQLVVIISAINCCD